MRQDKFVIDGAEFVTVQAAAEMLGRKVRTIRDWIYKGKLNAIKDGRGYRWLIPIDEVQETIGGAYADKD